MDEMTTVVFFISIGVILIAAAIIAVLCLTNKRLSTRALATAGVSLALSFVLSLIKVSPVTYGGSITLASMLPIIIFAYIYGFFPALITGIIFGLMQFLSSPYVLTPFTFLLDYVYAFGFIFVVPLVKKAIKNKTAAIIIGICAAYLGRFIMHFVSGIIYFNMGAVWAELPAKTAVGYSLLYNVIYLVPDFLITAISAFALSKLKVIDNLEKLAER